ncbi:MAG: sigma-70 family RNA polymerase sigma factor [Actinobacteria bacterium]|nr:sigma-70 family RNA polymerase sigma factor [Actinomycetota bacterium]
MSAIHDAARGDRADDADAALRELYARHAQALHGYVDRFSPGLASTDDIVQETFIRAWRHLPQLATDERLVRPWLFRVARNLLIDADRRARSRPVTIAAGAGLDLSQDDVSGQIIDRQLLAAALAELSPAHRVVLVETFYRGGTMAAVARRLGIPAGTARSRLHYALDALRQQLPDAARPQSEDHGRPQSENPPRPQPHPREAAA